MSARRRRQTRHRTFGWRAEISSPPAHNQSVRTRKAIRRADQAFRELARAANALADLFAGLRTR